MESWKDKALLEFASRLEDFSHLRPTLLRKIARATQRALRYSLTAANSSQIPIVTGKRGICNRQVEFDKIIGKLVQVSIPDRKIK